MRFKTPETIANDLNRAIDLDEPTEFLRALGTVVRAKGKKKTAAMANCTREEFNAAIGPRGSPAFQTVCKIVHSLGVRIVLLPLEKEDSL